MDAQNGTQGFLRNLPHKREEEVAIKMRREQRRQRARWNALGAYLHVWVCTAMKLDNMRHNTAHPTGTGVLTLRERGHELAPAKLAAQCLSPGHGKIAHAHRDAALDHHLAPVPAPPTPTSTKFEPPALTGTAGFPPEVARHP